MSSRVERSEYHSARSSSRTMSPATYSRNGTSKFDNSLDNLLEDLQSTVSKPLTNGNTNYSHDNSLKSPHLITATPVTDYTTNDAYSYTAPDGTQHYKTVKTEHYHYNSKGGTELPPEKLRMQDNINQLDSLLDDLQQAKQADTILGVNTNNNNIQHQAEYYKSKSSSGKTIVERAVPNTYSERSRSLERNENRIQSYQHREGSYGDIKSLRTRTPSPTFTKKVNVTEYPVEIVETTNPEINPEVLAGLDPEILPSGNTKVTTTIKTYTYEIPGNVDPDEYVQKALQQSVNHYESQNQSNQSITTPSKSFVYSNKNYENTSNTSSLTRSGRQTPTSPHPDRKVIRETITTKNYHPDNKIYTDTDGKRTYIYNETVKTRDYKDHHSTQHHQPVQYVPAGRTSRPQTPKNDVYTTYTTETTQRSSSRGPRDDSPDRTSLPPVTTTIHKFDSMTNLNARQYPEVETFDPKHPPGNISPVQQYPVQQYPVQQYPVQQYPVHQYPEQPEVNITYKYRSTTNTTNKYNTERYDNEPIMPRKFPLDEVEGPPKKLDELMAQIGNEPPTNAYNSGWSAHERELQEQRKIDSLKASQEYERKKKEEAMPTKNVTGPPVYYPPGHEMFAHKEEIGWRAQVIQGGMAKESAKYKYEAGSSSKSKSSSGAAIVPVCLPLCCGLPCTII